MARLRNFGLLLFKPVVIDALLLKNIVPLAGEDEVDFCIIDDPFAGLSRGATVRRREFAAMNRWGSSLHLVDTQETKSWPLVITPGVLNLQAESSAVILPMCSQCIMAKLKDFTNTWILPLPVRRIEETSTMMKRMRSKELCAS
jgi:hypothetical protein